MTAAANNATPATSTPSAVVIACSDGLGAWTENDVAFQHLFVTTRGMPVPDWVTEGLPRMYQLLGEHARYREALQRIATSHPINDEPLATAHSLRAHKALRPDCKCGRCAPNGPDQR